MSLTSCLNSVSCLESWQRAFQFALVIGGVAGSVIGFALYLISDRISDLWADRAFTPQQEQAISNSLQGKHPTNFRIMAYGPAHDASEYGSKLEKLLIDSGWESKGLVSFHVGGGEEPPRGITIMVDGLHGDITTIGRQLEDALRMAHVEDVKFVIEKTLPDPLASTWVLIKIGRRANQ